MIKKKLYNKRRTKFLLEMNINSVSQLFLLFFQRHKYLKSLLKYFFRYLFDIQFILLRVVCLTAGSNI